MQTVSVMKSTTGLPMALAIFLLVSNLIQSLPLTASTSSRGKSHPCKIKQLIEEFVRPNLNRSLELYKEGNRHFINSWSEHVLEIPNETLPEGQKKKAAICGMKFMLEAITFILNNCTSDTESELRRHLNITIRSLGLANLQGCVHAFLDEDQCTTPTKLEKSDNIYRNNLWGCRVFKDSLKFVNWLKNFLHPPRHL